MKNPLPAGGFRAITLAALLVLATMGAGVGAVGASHAADERLAEDLGPYVNEGLEGRFFVSWETPEKAVKYGEQAYPGFIVHYSEGERSKLVSWVGDSSERGLLTESTDSNWALVSAPPGHVVEASTTARVFGRTLSSKDYVEHIGLNVRVSRVEPVELRNASTAFEKPKYADWTTLRGYRGEFMAEGVAYKSDANETPNADAKGYMNATGTGATGSGVVVGVIDTGLNYNSQIYGDRVIAGKNTVTNETANITHNADGSADVVNSSYSVLADGNLHGSFVTSQIAANTTGTNSSYMGVAPDSRIISVKALEDDGSGTTVSIAKGIEYASENGADILSMSLGSSLPQKAINEEIREAYEDDGVTAVVVAAGNSRQTYRYLASPADAGGAVIAVAATNGETAANAESAYFSNVGPDPSADGASPTVSAPGMKITTQVDAGSGLTTETLSGTSMATPLVAGALAQLLSAESGLRGQEHDVKARLKSTAQPMPNAGSTEVGAGMVDTRDLISNTEPGETQDDARTEDARSRDAANEALGGSLLRNLLEGGS